MNSLFQTPEWEQFKLATGYQESYRVDDVLVLQKRLPMGRSMLYTPMASIGQRSKVKGQNFISKIKDIASENKSTFYRLEIDDSSTEAISYQLKANSFIKSFEEMQPEHTLILDISKPEEEILAQMKQKGRYNIKVAEKNGVVVERDSGIENFYELYNTMAKRQKITFRSKQYYEKLFDILSSKGYVEVLTAYIVENKKKTAIASAVISFYGARATYLFGGSSDRFRNMMAPYLVQWSAIREARNRGCSEYDFFGIAPPDSPDHPWAGVTDFKKKFGGEEVELAGSWDLVLRPLEYKIFRLAEKVRRR